MTNKRRLLHYMAEGGVFNGDPENGGSTTPKGYKPLTADQRSQWNGFVRHLNRDLKVGGSKDLDNRTNAMGLKYMEDYRKANPGFSITPEMVPYVQYEFQQLKNTNSLPDQQVEGRVKNLINDYFKDRQVSEADGWIGSLTSRQGYPEVQEFSDDPQKRKWGLDYTGASQFERSTWDPKSKTTYSRTPPTTAAPVQATYANGGTMNGGGGGGFMTNGTFSTAANAGAGIIDGLDQGTPYGRKRIGTTVASGALSGAALGASVGGPWGAVIGGVVGAGVGLFKGKSDKRKEDRMISAQNAQRQSRIRDASAAAIAADPGLIGGYGNRGYYARGGSLRNALPGYSGDQNMLSDYIMDTNPWLMDGELQSDALDGRLQLKQGGRITDYMRRKRPGAVPPEMAHQYGFPAQVPVQVNAEGGQIHIKPENKGKFTASASRAGMGVQEFASHVLANKDDYSSTQVKRANFARNASKWHAHGGILSYMGKAQGRH